MVKKVNFENNLNRTNIEIISSLIYSNQDKEEFLDYIENNEDVNFNDISMEKLLKWVWLDRHELINNNEKLKNYFINLLMKEYSDSVITYRGISFDRDTVIDLDLIKDGSYDKLISTTKDIEVAKSFAMSYDKGVIIECTSNQYTDLSDFEVNNEKEVVMYNPDMRIINFLNR